MFEGPPPNPANASAIDAESQEYELRALSWDELMVRLAAAKDHRRQEAALNGLANQGDASFDSGSAQRLAARKDGKNLVYLDDSDYGKEQGRTVVADKSIRAATRGNT